MTTNPASILGDAAMQQLHTVRPDGWYPIDWMLELMDQLHAKLGDAGLTKMGRELFKQTHAEQVRGKVTSARDLLFGFDGIYRFANRGEAIGGWKVEVFRPGHAELEKTTPHHCVMEQGILTEALGCVGTPAVVAQQECFRKGASACRFVIRSAIQDARWSGVDA